MSAPGNVTPDATAFSVMPERAALTVRGLYVRRMRSIDVPYALTDLSPGVNIVHGANGSGKSSTALALQVALWPDAPSRHIDVSCEFTIDGVHLSAHVADDARTIQRGARAVAGSVMPAWDHHLRYRLSLHDLLVASDTGDDEFARQIALASTGFRFDEARTQLGFRDRHTGRVDEAAGVTDATEQVRKQQAAQRAMHEQQQHLAQWRAELTDARTAHARQLTAQRAIEHARLLAEHTTAQAALTHFDSELASVPINAVERAEELSAQQHEARSLAQQDLREAAQLRTSAASRLPSGPATPDAFAQLRALGEALAFDEAALAQADRDVAAREEEQALCRTAVANHVSHEQLQRLATTAFADVEQFVRDAEAFRGRWEAATAEVTLAQSMHGELPTSTREQVERGVQLLGAWLRDEPPAATEAAPAPTLRPYLVVLAIAAVSLGVMVAVVNTGPWLMAAGVVVIAALIVAGIAYKVAAPPVAVAPRPVLRPLHEEEYRALALRLPTAWSTRDVQQCMDVLHRELAALALHERREEWRRRALTDRDALLPEREALDARHTALLQQLGVSETTGPGGIMWLVLQVAAWQQATTALDGARAAQGTARAAMQRTQQQIAACVASVEPDTIAGEWRGEEVIYRADRWMQQWNQAQQELDQAVRAEQRAADQLARADRLQEELTQLFATCRCPLGDTTALRDRVAQKPQYDVAQRHVVDCAQRLGRAREALQEDPYFHRGLLDSPVSQLTEWREQLTQLADRAAPLADQVAQLEAQMQQVGSAQQLEAALVELAERESALDACWRRDLEAMIGHAVLEEVRRATRDTERPAVFVRARELFAQITRGRYRLDFHDGMDADVPSFRAFDVETHRTHPVSELSTGTRVQLLLAVRVAFIERTETGVRLPLLIDEALGTSDEHRARAIMDAITALAAAGRQVFYFTAQREEVAKWEQHLAPRAVPFRVIDLDRLRALGTNEQEENTFVPTLPAPVPAPLSDESYLEYGARLTVSTFDPLRHDAASAHLWYVAPNVHVLHTLLTLGAQRCGPLTLLVEQSGADLLGDAISHWPALRGAMAAINALTDSVTTGLGARITRAHLEASEAVSEKKMAEVLDVLAQCGGRANAFWQAITDGAVKNFQTRQREKLHEYLQEQGLLDDRAPLTPELVAATVLRAITETGATDPQGIRSMVFSRLQSPPQRHTTP